LPSLTEYHGECQFKFPDIDGSNKQSYKLQKHTPKSKSCYFDDPMLLIEYYYVDKNIMNAENVIIFIKTGVLNNRLQINQLIENTLALPMRKKFLYCQYFFVENFFSVFDLQ